MGEKTSIFDFTIQCQKLWDIRRGALTISCSVVNGLGATVSRADGLRKLTQMGSTPFECQPTILSDFRERIMKLDCRFDPSEVRSSVEKSGLDRRQPSLPLEFHCYPGAVSADGSRCDLTVTEETGSKWCCGREKGTDSDRDRQKGAEQSVVPTPIQNPLDPRSEVCQSSRAAQHLCSLDDKMGEVLTHYGNLIRKSAETATLAVGFGVIYGLDAACRFPPLRVALCGPLQRSGEVAAQFLSPESYAQGQRRMKSDFEDSGVCDRMAHLASLRVVVVVDGTNFGLRREEIEELKYRLMARICVFRRGREVGPIDGDFLDRIRKVEEAFGKKPDAIYPVDEQAVHAFSKPNEFFVLDGAEIPIDPLTASRAIGSQRS